MFESASARLRATRTWACFPGAPAIETWTIYETYLSSSPVTIGDISQLELNVAGTCGQLDHRAFIRSNRASLRSPDSAGPLRRACDLTAPGRSSTAYLPVTWIDGDAGHLVTGLAWSGSWFMSASPAEAPARSAIRFIAR